MLLKVEVVHRKYIIISSSITKMQTGAILSIMVAVAAGYIGHILYRHEQRDLKVGSSAATPEMMAHESWEAVVDSEYTILWW